MGPWMNGAGAIIAILATTANIAVMMIEKSVWTIMFKGIVYAALIPS